MEIASSHNTVRFRVYYDFASTLCYVAHRVLSGVAAEIAECDVELEWRPIDLTMAAPWDRGDSFTPEVRETVHNTGLALGIDVQMPDPWLDSRPASQIALSMPSLLAESRWREQVFTTFFEQGTPFLTTELVHLCRELTGEEPPPESASDDLSAYPALEESTREAFALGITGVPTILLDNWAFGGVYDGDTMVSALRQLAERYRDLGASIVN
jgi:predicted DsbA family dithiol-disulfide isomerase